MSMTKTLILPIHLMTPLRWSSTPFVHTTSFSIHLDHSFPWRCRPLTRWWISHACGYWGKWQCHLYEQWAAQCGLPNSQIGDIDQVGYIVGTSLPCFISAHRTVELEISLPNTVELPHYRRRSLSVHALKRLGYEATYFFDLNWQIIKHARGRFTQ